MSYTILSGGKAIHCGTCGRISHNPTDVQQRYCGHCQQFHEDKLWGVFDRGLLLVADGRAQCETLVERWQRISGFSYEARELTEEEVQLAQRWEQDA